MNALIIVDVQYDFIPGGALPVKEGDMIIPIINKIQHKFDIVVATQDWHPPGHKSFASSHDLKVGDTIELNSLTQVLWPDHCIQESHGAEFVAQLDQDFIERVFQKGTDPNFDSYSGFFDNGHLKATGLGDFLKEKHVDEVHVVGLATDYCVKYTALDAVGLGFKTYLIINACRGVNLRAGDVIKAVNDMQKKGVHVIESGELSRAD